MSDPRNISKIGILYAVLAGVTYTGFTLSIGDVSKVSEFAPAALHMSEMRCHLAWSSWIICVQGVVTVALMGAYLMWQATRGRRVLPPRKELIALIILGLGVQFGVVIWTWSMSIVGCAVTSTITTAVTLSVVALLSFVILSERLTWHHLVAVVLVSVSVPLLSVGKAAEAKTASAESTSSARADQATESAGGEAVAKHPPLTMIILAVAAAALSGVFFAALSVGVRKTVTTNTLPQFIVFLVSLLKVTVLGPFSACLVGFDTLSQTSGSALRIMLVAGLFSLAGYSFSTMSLKWIPVMYSSILNNTTTAILCAAGGILLLAEGCNATILAGIALALGAIVALSLPKPAPKVSAELETSAAAS